MRKAGLNVADSTKGDSALGDRGSDIANDGIGKTTYRSDLVPLLYKEIKPRQPVGPKSAAAPQHAAEAAAGDGLQTYLVSFVAGILSRIDHMLLWYRDGLL